MATFEAFPPLLSLSCGVAARRIPPPIHHLRLSARPPPSISISCKARRGSGSSKTKKHRVRRKASKPPEDIFTNGNDMIKVGKVDPNIVSNSCFEVTMQGSMNGTNVCTTDGVNSSKILSTEEKNVTLVQNADIINRVPNHLEDLVCMIKTTEKNVYLLNEARLQALKDLHKVHAEKKTLQEQIMSLKIKLSENNENRKTAVWEKRYFTLEESKLKYLEKYARSRKIADYEVRVHVNGITTEVPAPGVNGSASVAEEYDALRKENLLLKDSIMNLEVELSCKKEATEYAESLEKERSILEESIRDLQHRFAVAQKDVSELPMLKIQCSNLMSKIESLEGLLASSTEQADRVVKIVQQNDILENKVKNLEVNLEEAKTNMCLSENAKSTNEILQQRVHVLEDHLQKSEEEINSHIQLYEDAVKEFQYALGYLKEQNKTRVLRSTVPQGFWSSLYLTVDGWLLEKKIGLTDAKLLRQMIWKRDIQIRDAYFALKDEGWSNDDDLLPTFIKLASNTRFLL